MQSFRGKRTTFRHRCYNSMYRAQSFLQMMPDNEGLTVTDETTNQTLMTADTQISANIAARRAETGNASGRRDVAASQRELHSVIEIILEEAIMIPDVATEAVDIGTAIQNEMAVEIGTEEKSRVLDTVNHVVCPTEVISRVRPDLVGMQLMMLMEERGEILHRDKDRDKRVK